MPILRFDPRIFIRAPYRACPKCGAEQSHGILGVYSRHYVRRCRECWYDSSHPLPELSKKVVYLDQLAVSNLALASSDNPSSSFNRKQPAFWRQLLARTSQSVRLQLAVFPDSSFHYEETVVASRSNEIRAMYESLAMGVSFRAHGSIQKLQLAEAARLWKEGLPVSDAGLNRVRVLEGDLHGWKDISTLVLDFRVPAEYIKEIRQSREQGAEALESLVDRWRTMPTDYWKLFEHEAWSFGEVIAHAVLENAQRWDSIFKEGLTPTLSDISDPLVELFRAVETALTPDPARRVEGFEPALKFIRSEAMLSVPFIRIRALLYAALARKVATGQRKVTRGTINDFEMIGTLLPYCDAMFVDRACHALLDEEPLRSELRGFETLVFSMRTGRAFLDFLDDLATQTSDEHRGLVSEVFGGDIQDEAAP